MSSLGVNPQLLISAPATIDSVPVNARSAARGQRHWIVAAMEAAADWAVVAAAASTVPLVRGCFFASHELRPFFTSIVQVPFCVAAMVVLLLANDGAYRRGNGPLMIRHAERPIRVALQAAMLILLLSLVVGASLPLKTIELSLLATMPLLIVEKRALSRRLASFLEDTHDLSSKGLCNHPTQEVSAFDQSTDAVGSLGDVNLPATSCYAIAKRVFDVMVSLLVLVATLPFLLIVALRIRGDSPGSIFFRQQRVGKNGVRFTIYKFRSMRTDAPAYEVSPADRKDQRITRIGRALRRTSIDEMPQLWNVIRGEMSLVGPRPEMPFLVEQHSDEHRRRLQALPGMTGLWQISPARRAKIHENLQYDEYYLQHRSLSMDLAILLCTPVCLLRGV
jgi:lipopolysaccharide/colanic/teichoic acid biosynthesis glycosyltransferase